MPVHSALILVYHSVSDQGTDPRYQPFSITPAGFAAQVRALQGAGAVFVPVEALITDPAPAPRSVAITFDDGLADFVSGALPVLQDAGVPAALFVVSGQIGGAGRWLADSGEGSRPMMTWPQIREAEGLGITIGAHSLTHRALDVLPAVQAAREIRESRMILEDGLGAPVRTFAYPYGYHGPTVRRLAAEAGYSGALAVKNARFRAGMDPFSCARMTVLSTNTPDDVCRWLEADGLPVDPGREALQTRAWRWVRRLKARFEQGRDAVPANL